MLDLSNTFSIQRVSEQAGVSKHTLRFWEKALEGVVVPYRTDGGQRRYSLEHLLVIAEIKKLKNQGMSLLEIKKHFDKDKELNRVDIFANRIAEMVKFAIYDIFKDGNLSIK